jgi:hypothetical protein
MKVQLNDLKNNMQPFVTYQNVQFAPGINDIVVVRDTDEAKTEHYYVVKFKYYDYEQDCLFCMVEEYQNPETEETPTPSSTDDTTAAVTDSDHTAL